MKKEFEVNDILSAVESISKKERKKVDNLNTKIDSVAKDDILPLNNQVKSNKSDVLVLDEMIE
tara:strand:+ start:1088 stop:1276 length:189 start_codon:yes stop_codon:yes gene_type:complete